MKKLFVILLLAFSTLQFQACSQNEKADDNINATEVPAAVQAAVTTKYPAAKDIKWERAKENDQQTFKAKFESDGKKVKAEFSNDGTFIKEKIAD